MSTMPPRGGQAGSAKACGRLALYRRYAELVAEQEVAVEAGDLDAFDALSREAKALQEHLGMSAVQPMTDDPEAGSPDFVEEVAELLSAMLRSNQRIQTHLVALRGDATQDIRRVAGGRPKARTYVDGGAERASSLDVTF